MESDIIKIQELEKLSRLLEPDPKQRQAVREGVVSYTEDFINTIETSPAYNESRKASEVFLHSPIVEDAAPLTEVLSLLKTGLDVPSLNPASGGHLGYIPGGGIYYSALGDYWADFTN